MESKCSIRRDCRVQLPQLSQFLSLQQSRNRGVLSTSLLIPNQSLGWIDVFPVHSSSTLVPLERTFSTKLGWTLGVVRKLLASEFRIVVWLSFCSKSTLYDDSSPGSLGNRSHCCFSFPRTRTTCSRPSFRNFLFIEHLLTAEMKLVFHTALFSLQSEKRAMRLLIQANCYNLDFRNTL